jgi:hypothetical protein
LTGGSFRVLGPTGSQVVNWAPGAVAFRDGSSSDIQVGARVEIYGTRKTDSSLAATRISFRKPSTILLVGQAFGTTTVSFNVFGLKVTVNESTRYKDSAGSNPLKTFDILDLSNGDSLKVTGFRDSTSLVPAVIATSVERIDAVQANPKILQGQVDSKELFPSAFVRKLTILGLDVQTTDGITEFLQADGNPFLPGAGFTAQDRFFDAVTPGQTVVKARGTAPAPFTRMIATVVEIEPVSEK